MSLNVNRRIAMRLLIPPFPGEVMSKYRTGRPAEI
jgi:hypothetical protein